MSAGFKRKPNDLALLLSFGETCALTILIAENEACHFRRSVSWEYHSKNNVSCIQGLQAEVEGAGAVRSEGSRSGEDWDELRAEASPEVASQLQLIVPKQECRLLWARPSHVPKRREETGLLCRISSFKILPRTPKLLKYSAGQTKHLYRPDLGLLFSISILNCVSFWSWISSAPRVPENVLNSGSSASPKGPLLSPKWGDLSLWVLWLVSHRTHFQTLLKSRPTFL